MSCALEGWGLILAPKYQETDQPHPAHYRTIARYRASYDALVSHSLALIMCYFEQTRWRCGFWKWGNFRQQCNKEYRTGETCGLKLVYDTNYKDEKCKLCDQIEKKQRRYHKMRQDVDRWRREGNRRATIEKTEYDMAEVQEAINKIWLEHEERLRTIG